MIWYLTLFLYAPVKVKYYMMFLIFNFFWLGMQWYLFKFSIFSGRKFLQSIYSGGFRVVEQTWINWRKRRSSCYLYWREKYSSYCREEGWWLQLRFNWSCCIMVSSELYVFIIGCIFRHPFMEILSSFLCQFILQHSLNYPMGLV